MSVVEHMRPVYTMTRLGKGDYLLPSNDAQTLWRLYRWEEGWNLWRWDGGFPTLDSINAALEMDDWSRWECWSGPFATRAEAIRDAIR